MIPTVKAKGSTGNWFAKINSEPFPCVHVHWLAGMHYNDVQLRPDDTKHAAFAAEIRRGGKVIVCRDDVVEQAGKPTEFKARTDYLALWSVANVEFDGDGLRFDLVERLAHVNR